MSPPRPSDPGRGSAADGPRDIPNATTVRFGFRRSYPFLLVLLPPLVYYMWICMTSDGGALVLPATAEQWAALAARVPAPTMAGLAIYGGWFLFQAALQALVPGPEALGAPLPDGTRLSYRMNGWISFWITIGACVLVVGMGWLPATLLWDHFGPVLTVAQLFTFVLAFYLMHLGRRDGKGEAVGNVVYQYFMGTGRNPRSGAFDWKLFCEARPGLILWVLIDFSIAAKQQQLHGHVSTPMALVCAFHLFYIADYYYHEEAILSTWDIKHENFGWMLCWGDLVWVPFTYTLQAQYLLAHPHELPFWAVAGIIALNFTGYYLFRSANLQKHRFSRDPERPIWGRKPAFIATRRGT